LIVVAAAGASYSHAVVDGEDALTAETGAQPESSHQGGQAETA
jgi:hypothetical protein